MAGSRSQGLVIQPRDRTLLAAAAMLRVIDREQAKVVAGFGSTTRANTRLLALTREGLLKRFFIGTIGGGRRAIYTLSKRGALLAGVSHQPVQRNPNRTLAGDPLLEHLLRISRILFTVRYLPIPQATFKRCIHFSRTISPSCPLVPDGYFEIETGGATRGTFLEVDLGTEALRRWHGKAQAYLQLAISGEFQRLFHEPQFRVLVVAPSGRRLERIRSVVARATDKIFRFATFDAISGHDFWSAIWLKPHGKDSVPIL